MRPEDVYKDPGGGFGGGEGSLLLPLLAVIVAVVAGFYAYDKGSAALDSFNARQEVVYPQGGSVSLEEGTNVVFYEPRGGISSVAEPAKGRFQRSVLMTGPSGEQVPVAIYGASVNFEGIGLDGYAMLTADIPADGVYEVSPGPGPSLAPPGQLVIARNFLGDLVRTIIAGVITLVAAILLLVALLSGRNKKSRLQRQAEAAGFNLPSEDEVGDLPKPPSEF